jgi:predicted MPP superfamily phosphohydrolase
VPLRFLVFFTVVTLVLGGGHVYIAWRVTAGMDPQPKRIVRILIGALPVLTLSTFFLRVSGVESTLLDGFSWLGWCCLGFSSLLFTLVVLRDVVWLGWRSWTRLRSGGEPLSPERRKLMLSSLGFGKLGLSGVLLGYGVFDVVDGPPIRKVTVPIPDLPGALDGFRIVQLTDIHIGATIKNDYVTAVAQAASSLEPDLVAITGDVVDGSVNFLRDDVAPLAEIASRHGIFVCTGNHEYYAGVHEWVAHFRALGMHVLLNEHELITHRGTQVLVAGVTDYLADSIEPSHHSSPSKAMAGAPEHALSLLLAHQPRSIHEAAKAGVDLQLSGHTHGGQFFPWTLFAHLAQPYVDGLHDHDGTLIYVSRGTGFWGPPLRLGAPSEITLLTLTRA